MSENLKFTVITPVGDDDGMYVEEAVKSVERQTIDGFEMILVGNLEGVEGIIDEKEFVKFEQTDANVSEARNIAIDMAEGEYIAFLDVDDTFHDEKLRQHYSTHQDDYDFVYSDTVDKDSGEYRDSMHLETSAPHIEFFKYDGCRGNIPTSSITVLRSLLREERFPPNITGGEDYHFWVRLLKEGVPYHIRQGLTRIRRRDDSLSSDPQMMYENRVKAVEDLARSYTELVANDRKKIENHNFGRHLLFGGSRSEARKYFLKAASMGYLRSLLFFLGSFLPVNHKEHIATLRRSGLL